jgi:squalene synthase HpnC
VLVCGNLKAPSQPDFANVHMSELIANPVALLSEFGPEHCRAMDQDQARAWCRQLAGSHYENFSVLSGLVPAAVRDDFAAVYAFCRWADDLGDESGSPQRAAELLAWWRRELRQCFDGSPRHPVFVALAPTIQRHQLPLEPFDNLIRAFEQDQTVTRYETWEQLIGYCSLSADPVGRLVLMLCGEERSEKLFKLSDAICTALQLTNHWQDVCRDILERDRIYIPREMITIDRFEERLTASARQGFAIDREFLPASRLLIKACVEKTWSLFDRGGKLLDHLSPRTQPIVWLFAAGGQHVLRQIEMWNYETVLHRPRLGKFTKLMLVTRAWIAARRGRAVGTTTAASLAGKAVHA